MRVERSSLATRHRDVVAAAHRRGVVVCLETSSGCIYNRTATLLLMFCRRSGIGSRLLYATRQRVRSGYRHQCSIDTSKVPPRVLRLLAEGGGQAAMRARPSGDDAAAGMIRTRRRHRPRTRATWVTRRTRLEQVTKRCTFIPITAPPVACSAPAAALSSRKLLRVKAKSAVDAERANVCFVVVREHVPLMSSPVDQRRRSTRGRPGRSRSRKTAYRLSDLTRAFVAP